MKKIFLILIFIFNLYAEDTLHVKNPIVFSSIGDKIYTNISNIESLKSVEKYSAFKLKIDAYAFKVAEAKNLGFSVQSGEKSEQKLVYLETLRTLEKENNYFYNSTLKSFNFAIKTQDTQLYVDLVNTGMIDLDVFRYKIFNYYTKHSDDIELSGLLNELVQEENAKKNKKRYVRKTKKQIQEEKMKRLRASDERNQKKLEEKLAKELADKKLQIRQEQAKELFKN